MTTVTYKRILLKLSGEALMGEDKYGINHTVMRRIVAEIEEISKLGVEIAIVVGGGNIFRGMKSANDGLERVTADYMGMLATVMNALALQDAMKLVGLVPRIQSALRIEQVVEPYIRGRAMRYLKDGRVVILQQEPAILSLLPIPQLLYVVWKWMWISCLKQQRWMAFIPVTQKLTQMRFVSINYLLMKLLPRICK